MAIPNVLADRYASSAMGAIFDPINRVRLERLFWLAVLEGQIDLGLDVDRAVLDDYRAVLDNIDLASIRRREIETRHDVKARLDEFCALAGHEHLHKGLTSRDATENVELLQVFQALQLVEQRTIALLARYAELAATHADQVIVGRTHNVPAQPTTVGKRFAQFGEELMTALEQVRHLLATFALRGIKGPVGSQQDQVDLLGSGERAGQLEERVASHLGVPRVLNAVAQVYPRSRDFAVVSSLVQLASGPANTANSIRLMAGHDLATEGFRPGQVGSSAMPHKMNTRSCERINGLTVVLQGHLAMASGLVGGQWNEGDVACSVVRRIVIPDAFFALDGLYETTFSVLNDFGVFEGVIESELDRYLPFLGTTTLLMHAIRHDLGRETAHELIKEHAVATALELRAGTADGSLLVRLLAEDQRFPGNEDELNELLAEPSSLTGLIEAQVAGFCAEVGKLTAGVAEANYRGEEIL